MEKTIVIKNPKAIEIIKKMIDDKNYIYNSIRNGKSFDEIKKERPDIFLNVVKPI